MIVSSVLGGKKSKQHIDGNENEREKRELYLLLFRNLPRSLYQGRQGTQRFGQLEEGVLE